jgi:lipid-A-disaccharide synthase
MDPKAPRLAMVAGEASGDLLAGLLMRGLNARWPALKAHGIGGPKMAAQGFEAWWPHDKLAVRGYVEVLKHYREISAIREQLAERLLADKPDLFIGVDAPDFNLDLETRLKAQGIKTIHFVSPSIARRWTRCCASSRSSRRSMPSRASPPPTSATRWPMRSRSRCRAPPAASR